MKAANAEFNYVTSSKPELSGKPCGDSETQKALMRDASGLLGFLLKKDDPLFLRLFKILDEFIPNDSCIITRYFIIFASFN